MALELDIRGRDTLSPKLRTVAGHVDKFVKKTKIGGREVPAAFRRINAAAQVAGRVTGAAFLKSNRAGLAMARTVGGLIPAALRRLSGAAVAMGGVVRGAFGLVIRGAAKAATAIKLIPAAMAKMTTAAKAMAATVRRAFLIVQLAAAGVAVATILVGAKFEQQMANVSAVAGGTGEDLQRLESTARTWGANTAFSATQVAEAMYSLASAGLEVSEIQKTVGGVLQFAGAAATNMGLAAELVTSQLAAFNLQAEDSGRVVNVFAAAIANSRLNADRLSASLPFVANTASLLGLAIEETTAAIGLLVNRGMEASMSATSLNQALVQLIAPNETLAGILGDVSVKGDGVAAVLRRIQEVSPSEGVLLKAFGNIRAARAMFALTQAGAEALETLTKKITGTKTAAEAYDKQMNTVTSQFAIFKSAMEETMIATFESLNSEIRESLDAMQNWAESARPQVVAVALAVRELVVEHRSALVVIGKLTGALAGLLIVWWALTSPIVAVVALAGIAAAAYIRWEDTVNKAVSTASVNVSRFANKFIEDHREAIDGVLGFFKFLVNKLIGHFVFLARLIWIFVGDFKGFFKEAITTVWGWLKQSAAGWGQIFSALGVKIGSALDDINAKMDDAAGDQSSIWQQKLAEITEAARVSFQTDYVGALASGIGMGTVKVVEGLKTMKAESGKWWDEMVDQAQRAIAEQYNNTQAPPAFAAQQAEPTTGVVNLASQFGDQLALMGLAWNTAQKRRVDEARAADLEIAAFGLESSVEWFAATERLINDRYEAEITKADATGETIAQARIEREQALFDTRIAFEDAYLEKWIENHRVVMAGLDGIGGAYNDIVNLMIHKDENHARIREALMMNFRRAFIGGAATMFKNWVKLRLQSVIFSQAQEAAIGHATKVRDAKTGARRAYSAYAAIPFVGPALGTAAAAQAFAFLMAFAQGGLVPGAGRGDIVPARLEPREFVIQRSSADRIGTSDLEFINRTGTLPKSGGGGPTTVVQFGDITISGTDPEGLRRTFEDELIPMIEDAIDDRRLKVD